MLSEFAAVAQKLRYDPAKPKSLEKISKQKQKVPYPLWFNPNSAHFTSSLSDRSNFHWQAEITSTKHSYLRNYRSLVSPVLIPRFINSFQHGMYLKNTSDFI